MQKITYHQLREEDRHIIYRMRKAGNTQQQIANILGYSQSAISKELSRNRGQRGYRPKQAHEKSSLRQANKASRSRVISGALEAGVIERLKRKHSPEQISGGLCREGMQAPSRTSIYNFIQLDRRCGGTLLSLYERKSRLGKLIRLDSKDAETTAEAIIAALKELCVHTITYDNGLEFSELSIT